MVVQNDSNSLLVPVFLDAWVVDSSTQQTLAFYNAEYKNLADYTDPLPQPEIPCGSKRPAAGVYLHWALPDALTHASHDASFANQDSAFPLVPNRWVVVRFDTATQWKMTAWVVQSDFVADAANAGTAAFLDPTKQPSISGTGAVTLNTTQIGASYEIGAWEATGDPGTPEFFLTAVAPGNISFAAYQPFCGNVFSFTDNSLPAAGTTVYNYSYLVVGWYSDPTKDPLAGMTAANFAQLLQACKWSLPKDTALPAQPPTTSLYHGFTADVTWPSGIVDAPLNNTVQVAVGNTAIDALSALIQAQATTQSLKPSNNGPAWIAAGNTLCSLMQAAMLQLLDDYGVPGGATLVQQQVEQSWFGSGPGGTVWHVVPATASDASFNIAGSSLTSAQQTAIIKQLANLNASQQHSDKLQRTLATTQSQLYMTWLAMMQSQSIYSATGVLGAPSTTPEWSVLQPVLQNSLYPDSYNDTWQQFCTLQTAIHALPTSTANANTWAAAHWQVPSADGTGCVTLDSLNLVLKGTAAPVFQHPIDPVVLISGAGMTNKHGRDGIYNADGTLTVRLGGDTITGIQVNKEPAITAPAFAKQQLFDQLATYTAIPAIPNLLAEAFFLDPANAATMIATVPGPTPTMLETCISDLVGGSATSGATWIGTPPSPMGYKLWTQAWSPLWLEWIVNYCPTVSASNNMAFDMSCWAFDGKQYSWNGQSVEPFGSSGPFNLEVKGRNVAMPYAQTILQTAVNAYLKDNPAIDNTELDSLLTTVMGWDILAQSLGGLTDYLAKLETQTSIPPPHAGIQPPCPVTGNGLPATGPLVGDLVQDQYGHQPQLNNGQFDFSGNPYNTFFPVRGGLVSFAGLQMVDAFGQSLTLYGPPSPGNVFQPPLVSQSLTPTASVTGTGLTYPFMLSPRLVQESRLNLDFMANDGSASLVTSSNNNPICGWLLPNHLNNSIDVYDGDGHLLGEVLQLTKPDNLRQAPGAHSGAAFPANISNTALANVVNTLGSLSVEALGDFMQVIDETLWMSDPLGGQSDTFMSALMGRPLAVVMMDISLELSGNAMLNQDFNAILTADSTVNNYTLINDTGGVESIAFPVSLGSLQLRNDGLMGYFINDTVKGNAYSNFYSVHTSPTLSSNDQFIQPVIDTSASPNTYKGQLMVVPNGKAQTVTLILDPLGVVHAYTGILPVASAGLPGYLVQDFLKKMLVNFQTGPILADPGTLRTPEPAEKQGVWNWLQKTDNQWKQEQIVDANDSARFPLTPPDIREGWLQLTGLDSDD